MAPLPPQLADFGLTKLLREEHDVINLFGAGDWQRLVPLVGRVASTDDACCRRTHARALHTDQV